MSIVVTEAKLTEGCQARIPDEQVLSTGLFQPYGSGVVGMEGVGAGESVAHAAHPPGVAGALFSAAAGIASQRGLAAAEGVPPSTALAVTATKIYAFDASAGGGLTATADVGDPYAVWDRATVAVHTTNYVGSFSLVIDDPGTGKSWEYKGNRLYQVGGKIVAHLLTDPAAAHA
jgi:hypothetical protein